MAITNARMQIKRGNEVDFDAEKMLVGEWALSTDKRIVRICVAPNTCIRMATYDAFEVDMAQIEKILEECQSIEEAVVRINAEVSENAQAVVEYTEQAKKYRDEAKAFRDEAEQFAPEGYAELKETVASNTAKIDTIIEKAELNIKNSASGENIHLTDSANGKNVAFGLYGKAKQKQYSGKNLLENTATTQTVNGVTFTVNEDKSVTVNGTATAETLFPIFGTNNSEEVLLLGNKSYTFSLKNGIADKLRLEWFNKSTRQGWTTTKQTNIPTNDVTYVALRVVNGSTIDNVTVYPMIRPASITDDTYEPYTGGIASPNPDYPQEIEVAGASGSVEVVSCGENVFNPKNVVNGAYNNGYVNTDSWKITVVHVEPNSDITLSGFSVQSGAFSAYLNSADYTDFNRNAWNTYNNNGTHTIPSDVEWLGITYLTDDVGANLQVERGTVATPYEPYTETVSTIPTPDGLCGIKVSSGGNYTDENGQKWVCDEIIKHADGTGKYVQRIEKTVLNGTESWGVNDGSRFSSKIVSGNTYNAICSHAMKRTVAEMLEVGNGFYLYTSGYMDFTNSSYTTVADFKEWLTSNNVTVLYELAEPIITDLSAEEIAEIEKLQTFYPVTNISNDAECYMEVAYKADAKNYIDNIILARVATLETAVINNL